MISAPSRARYDAARRGIGLVARQDYGRIVVSGKDRAAYLQGLLTNDIVAPALLGGLVLIVMLIGFTVMQHAFAGGITTNIVSDVEMIPIQQINEAYERMIKGDPGAESVYFWDKTRKGVDRRGAGPMDASVFGRGAGEGVVGRSHSGNNHTFDFGILKNPFPVVGRLHAGKVLFNVLPSLGV